MTNFRALAVVFVVLTIVFGASTGYLLASPRTVTQMSTTTQVSTSTVTVSTAALASSSSAPPSSSAAPAFTVGVAYNSTIGYYLTNATGFTLYQFKLDKPNNGTSACYGTCATNWPPFRASTVTAPPGISASSFGSITRKDGTSQVTYEGWPLYYFHKDVKAGDTLGQGLSKVWFAFTTASASSSGFSVGIGYNPKVGGFYLTDGAGFTLYLYKKDTPGNGSSTCYGNCEAAWPPFYASPLKLPPGLNASGFATITRTDGKMQLTYNGWPLYYFAKDTAPGDTTGQGLFNVWYVLPVLGTG